MTARGKLLLTSALGTLAFGSASLSTALAADADMVTKAAPVETGWWYNAYVEVGGRFFVNNPQKNGIKSQGGDSLAKYYEYSDIKPGAFGNFNFSAGSRDGLYQIDAGGKNVGYEDQAYFLEASKAGEHYLGLGWDQTPHVYSMSAQTLYNGVGTDNLTIPSSVRAALNGGTPGANIQTTLNNSMHTTDIGIRRDTASVEYRYTPTDAWDIRVNYTNLRRTGTQVDGMVMGGNSGSTTNTTGSVVAVQVPKPVHDTTENYGASGEYAGTSFWGKKFNIKVAYGGSTYRDDSSSYTVQNPFCVDGGTATNGGCKPGGPPSLGNPGNLNNLESLWPDNQANAMTTTLGADLPLNSRYVNTTSYTMMRQNQQFLPFTSNPSSALIGTWSNPAQPNSVASLPAQNLDGSINTLLVNNVVTTQITSDLKSKLSYRYYDYANGTPEIRVPVWVVGDAAATAGAGPATYANVSSLSLGYTKQDGKAEVNWRPVKQLNFGGAYGYESYDWTRSGVNTTAENSGKVYVDFFGANGTTARASWEVSDRRLGNYDPNSYFGTFQWPGCTGCLANTAYRQFMIDNRLRNKGNAQITFEFAPGLTFTPTASLLSDDFGVADNQFGLKSSTSLHLGAELAWLISPDTTLLMAYMNENYDQFVRQSNGTGLTGPGSAQGNTEVIDRVNTLMFAVNHTVIPNRLDLKFNYSISRSVDHQPLTVTAGTALTSANQFPDVTGTFQRFDANALYTFDQDLVRRMGWNGTVTARLRYSWERNAVNNWNDNQMSSYMYAVAPTTQYMTWMAYDNPNYNVHMVSASLGFKW
jgi:MtrB/PioB family decaheme-associated outer membrane protein